MLHNGKSVQLFSLAARPTATLAAAAAAGGSWRCSCFLTAAAGQHQPRASCCHPWRQVLAVQGPQVSPRLWQVHHGAAAGDWGDAAVSWLG